MAAGEHREAIATFQVPCAAGDAEVAADAAYYLGIAQAKGGDTQGALEAIDRFLTGYPGDPRAAWLAEFRAGLQGQLRPPCHALLIGIGQYQDARLTPLSGAWVDVEAVLAASCRAFRVP